MMLAFLLTFILIVPTSVTGDKSFEPKSLAHFNKLDLDNPSLLKELIHPWFGYFISDYYFGYEPKEYGFERNISSQPLLPNIGNITNYSLIHVETVLFVNFTRDYLPLLNIKFFLMTGRWQLPAIEKSSFSDSILADDKVLHWFMQNPVYEHMKVTGVPYGLEPRKLHIYATALKKSSRKRNKLLVLNVSPTHASRTVLIDWRSENCPHDPHCSCYPNCNQATYLNLVNDASLLISPVGDRPDCYRHWEAIGLGTMPICNCPQTLRQVFGHNMIFVEDSSDYIKIINMSQEIVTKIYREPDRKLVLSSYWKRVIYSIMNFKKSALESI